MLSHDPTPSVVIVGAGHAGGTLAGMLRQNSFTGRITLCGDEIHPPYHRPPLSKKYTGSDYVQWLKPENFYADNDVEVKLGSPVIGLDRARCSVSTAGGESLEYSTLVIATGAAPRMLTIPGSDLEGVVTLRTLVDAERLRDAVIAGSRIAIIGGGYVGLEVAASARARGCTVTVIERENRVLARVASAELAETLSVFHRERGTRILTSAHVQALEGSDGKVRCVTLADGSTVQCDLALVGIGAIPNDTLARDSGIACESGIVVDSNARTNDPRVFAIGDVTYRMHDTLGRRVRLESIPSAIEQARHAAAVISGSSPPPHEVPWFWSDQFDLKMKMAGMITADSRAIRRGDPRGSSFALFHIDTDGIPVAVETVNAAPEFMAGKKFIGNRTELDLAALADPDVPLRDTVL